MFLIQMMSGLSVAEIVIILAVFALSITIGISCHEWAHAFAAYKSGDPTAKQMGRMTLNPAKHMEPMGLLCFVLVGFGWARPVPVNPFNYRNFKRGNFWVSIAGILTNLVLGFIFSFGIFMFIRFDLVTQLPNGMLASDNLVLFGLGNLFMLGMVINLSLAVFNLLPIYPLDGYNLLVSFTKPNNSFMRFMRERGMMVLIIVLFVIPLLFGVSIIFEVRGFLMDAFLSFWGLFI
jgi:Zn-dependent protease